MHLSIMKDFCYNELQRNKLLRQKNPTEICYFKMSSSAVMHQQKIQTQTGVKMKKKKYNQDEQSIVQGALRKFYNSV